jgi:hypothetical protein
MPWDVVKDDSRCPASAPFAVVGGDGGGNKLFGCHATADSARQQQKALYAATEDEPGRTGLTPDKAGERAGGTGMPAPVLPVSLPMTIAW